MLIGADEGELILLHSDATWEGIAQYCFIPATRANVRATDGIASSAAGGP